MKRIVSLALVLVLTLAFVPMFAAPAAEPLFEPTVRKAFCVEDDFCESTILVVLDKAISGINKPHDPSFFGSFPKEEIIELTALGEGVDAEELGIDEENWRQIFKIVLPIDCKENVLDAITELQEIQGIRSAEPNFRLANEEIEPEHMHICTMCEMPSMPMDEPSGLLVRIPNDPLFKYQWALPRISAPEAWAITTGSRDVKIGILDYGITAHSDLDANFVPGLGGLGAAFRFGPHGTPVAGIVGAEGNNGIGVAGINWEVSLVPLNFHPRDPGYGEHGTTFLRYVMYATENKIPIITESWQMLTGDAVRAMIQNYPGLYVTSATNDRRNVDEIVDSIFWLDNVIAVAASINDPYDTIANFSNYGPESVHLLAPGVDILGPHPESWCIYGVTWTPPCPDTGTPGHGQAPPCPPDYPRCLAPGYHLTWGTSFAAPHVAGAAALLLSANPNLTTAQLKAAILDNVDIVPGRA